MYIIIEAEKIAQVAKIRFQQKVMELRHDCFDPFGKFRDLLFGKDTVINAEFIEITPLRADVRNGADRKFIPRNKRTGSGCGFEELSVTVQTT